MTYEAVLNASLACMRQGSTFEAVSCWQSLMMSTGGLAA